MIPFDQALALLAAPVVDLEALSPELAFDGAEPPTQLLDVVDIRRENRRVRGGGRYCNVDPLVKVDLVRGDAVPETFVASARTAKQAGSALHRRLQFWQRRVPGRTSSTRAPMTAP